MNPGHLSLPTGAQQGRWVGRSDVVRWLEIALLQDLDKLLDAIIREVPKTVGARDCSIYLLPQFVKQFDGMLTEGNATRISHTDVDENFIVSARSTQPHPKRAYGKAFYRSGEGLTGWVFQQRRPLLLRDMWNKTELSHLKPPAHHSDKYGLGKDLGSNHRQPFLAMPLTTAAQESLGVLKLIGTHDSTPFPSTVQDFLQPVVRALADLIQRTTNFDRMKGMKKLMATLAATSSLREVLDTAASELPPLVDSSHCSVFLRDEKTGYYVLRATSDRTEGKVDKAYHQPGQGLAGWVASRKRPLRLKNLADRAELKAIDPDLQLLDKDEEFVRRPTRQFLAAPLLSTKDREPTLGVIRFLGHRFNQSFTADDERLLVEFTSSFVQILEAVRVRELSGQISAIKDLFLASTLDRERLVDEAVQSTDRVFEGDGCSLFLKDERSGRYVLRATSAPSLVEQVDVLEYAEGEGKTGRVVRERRPLRLNPVDETEVSVKESVEADIRAGAKFLAAPLLAASGEPMGVLRLVRQQNNPDFSQVDENLLSSIASMLGLSLRTLAAHETNQQIARALLSIAETNVQLVRDQHRLPLDRRREMARWLALTTVTSHDGLRFSRAAFFTYNAEERTVTGVCGVGPGTVEEADRLWNHAMQMSFDQLVQLNIQKGSEQGFHQIIKDQRLTLISDEDQATTLPWATCVEPQAYRVQDGKAELVTSDGFMPSMCSIHPRFLDLVGCDRFALIPFSGLDAMPGVLYVDNCFNGRPISMDQLRPLTVFADFFRTSMSLAEAQDRLLLRSARLATLGEFAASFSHQARQPLQIISGAVQLMEGDPTSLRKPDVRRKRLTELREGMDRMDAALRYLNGFARRDFGTTRDFVKVGETLRHVVGFVEKQLNSRGIELKLEVSADLPDVLASQADLEDVLLNLIANARDAMEGQGGLLTLRAFAHEDHVAVEVTDTGGGIPEDDLDVIFEPLFSTKPTEKGMGMGLALSRRLAVQMGGSLVLTRNGWPDGGATFVLDVPTGGKTR